MEGKPAEMVAYFREMMGKEAVEGVVFTQELTAGDTTGSLTEPLWNLP